MRKDHDHSQGWIKIHRSIKDHWLWKSDKLRWWLDILLSVNHTDHKVLIRCELFECKRGQSVRSLETWAKEWGVSKQTVKEFLALLQKDGMITRENLKITTRITVCNYDMYQDTPNNRQTVGRQTAYDQETETYSKQECKNENNEKNISGALQAKKTIPPTLEMVREYCSERKNNVDPEQFIDAYTSKGWMIGKNRMKDWQAAVRLWEKNSINNNKNNSNELNRKHNSRNIKRVNSLWNN
jgi:hypothetical protein